jgi:hypothetical protein
MGLLETVSSVFGFPLLRYPLYFFKKKSEACLKSFFFLYFLNPQRNRTDIDFDEQTEGRYIDLRKNSA